MSVLTRSLRFILAIMMIFTSFAGVASASIPYDATKFGSINKADTIVSDAYFSFSGEDAATPTPNSIVGVDGSGVYLMKNDKINPSSATSGTIHIKPKDAGKVFTIESLNVNAAAYGSVTFTVRFNNSSTPAVAPVTITNSNRDSTDGTWNYKRITFSANAVTSVDIDITDTSNSSSPPVVPAVGQNSTIVDFVVTDYPTAVSNYTLTYAAGANGAITGSTPQTVVGGGSGTAVTAIPNTGYYFVNWSDGVTTAMRTDTNVTGNVSVTANFAIYQYTLTYTAGSNGTLTGTTSQTVNHGSDATTVTANPASHYHFVDWSDGKTTATRTDTNVQGNLSVTANFALDTYTLSYAAGAHGTLTGSASQTVGYNLSGTAVTAVPDLGYHFVNWSDGKNTATRTDTNVTANNSVTANFALNAYTLTYTAGLNGTLTGNTPQTVTHGSNGTAVTAEADANYHFVDWSDGKTTATRTDTNVQGDLDVTANFALDTYTLSYAAGAHGTLTGSASQTVGYNLSGTAVTAVPDLGYHFVNWSDGKNTATRTDTNVTANNSVTANFALNAYTLTYTAGLNGTLTGNTPQTVTHGSNGTAVTAEPDAHYHFVDWSDGKTTATRTDTNVQGDLDVTANFALDTYTLSYAAGAHGTLTGMTPQTVNYGSDGTAVTAIADPGYHFVDWSDGKTSATRTDTNVTANNSVTANFALNAYTLTYTAGSNGTLTGTTPQTVAHGSNGTAVTAEPDAHYHFVDWSDGKTTATRTDTNVQGDLDAMANFALDTYTLSYAAGAHGTLTGMTPQTVNYGSDGTAVTAVADPGYHFVDWSDGKTSATRTDTNVTANNSVTANFTLNAYTLTYTAGSNGTLTGTTPQTVTHGSNGTAVTAEPDAHYHFVDWSDGKTTATRTDTNVQGDLDATANFALDTYTLSYAAGAHGTLTGIVSQTVGYNLSGTAVTAVADTGYHFVDWSDGKTSATRTDTNVTANNSVTANFALNAYTLAYTAGAHGTLTGSTPQTVNHGSDGTLVTAVADPGYHFVDWSDGKTTAARMDTNVQEALNVTANFAPVTHTLSYTAGVNGTLTGTASQRVDHGSDGTAVTAVPGRGYHFVDWSDGLATATRTDANVLTDVNVSANFAINEYTLTYTPGVNGTLTGTLLQTVQYGSDGTTVTAVAYGGYHFIGWSDGKATATRTDLNVQGDLSVTANFDEDYTSSPSAPVSGGGAADSSDKDVIVLVNGKAQHAGVATTTQVNNQTVTTISVDEKIIEQKIAQEGRNAKITIPVHSESDVVIGQLSGQMIKNMEQSQATIEIATERATYSVPAQQLQLDKVIAELGQQVNLQDLQLQITVAKPSEDMVGTVVKGSGRGGFTLLVPPVEFTIKAVYGNQTIEITHFNAYVERTLALPENVDPSKITTGIVVEPDGTVRHVPTKVIVIEGKYYAQVSSLTNSAYAIVWHPITFSDMTKHWAKDTVNDMGSRMVINGVNDNSFAPDQDITRAEFAAVIVRALGLKLESGSAPFSDVKAADWYNEVIQTAYNYGLINGFEDGTFRPADKITREQAAVIIAKAMVITALKNKLAAGSTEQLNQSYRDDKDVSNWAESGMMDCLQSGIVTGRAEQSLAPKAYITRAEVAVMTQRLLQKSGLI